jgi:hypothetical protein
MEFGVPGDGFVVVGVVSQAAVQDADQPVRQRAQGLVMCGAATALGVVVGPRPGRGAERGERLPVEGVGQAAVAGGAGRTTRRRPEARLIGAMPE